MHVSGKIKLKSVKQHIYIDYIYLVIPLIKTNMCIFIYFILNIPNKITLNKSQSHTFFISAEQDALSLQNKNNIFGVRTISLLGFATQKLISLVHPFKYVLQIQKNNYLLKKNTIM